MKRDTVWTTTLPSITEASYTCPVRQHEIHVCKDLPHGIYATRELCENRRRVSVRRAIQGRQQWPWSYLGMWYKCHMLNYLFLHSKLNVYAITSNRTIARTRIVVGLLVLQDFFDRITYVSNPSSKNFWCFLHRVTTTHTTVVFFQMVELLRPLVIDYQNRRGEYYLHHKR